MPGNKYLYAKLANKHCLNDRGSRIFRLEEGSLAALMSSRGNRRDHSGSRLDRERSSPTTRMKEGHTESRERGMEKKSRMGGARTDLLRYLRLVSRLFREECWKYAATARRRIMYTGSVPIKSYRTVHRPRLPRSTVSNYRVKHYPPAIKPASDHLGPRQKCIFRCGTPNARY